jgi:hypothetical protein
MRLIAISGKRGAGKDEAARIIRDVLAPELNWQTVRFAAPLKSVAAEITGEHITAMYSQRGKAKFLPDWGMTVGELQQQLGEKICELNPQAWVFPLLRNLQPYGSYLITDVRKPVEADALRRAGALMLRIEGNPAGLQGDGTRDDAHISETGLDDYDFDVVIDNHSTLAALQAQLHEVLVATCLI